MKKRLVTVSFALFFVCNLAAGRGGASVALEEKLRAQWENYSEARALLLERVKAANLPIEQRLTSREEWERVIALQGDYALGSKDLAQLRRSQRERIESSRVSSIRESRDAGIDLDTLRALPSEDAQQKITAFCEKLPKGGMLHIHPGGTLSRDTVARLLSARNPLLRIHEILSGIEASSGNSMLYPDEVAWLSGLGASLPFLSLTEDQQLRYAGFLFLPSGKQPFERFNAVFAFMGTATSEWSDYEEAVLDFARRAAREGVSYVEFTSGNAPEFLEILKRTEAMTGLAIRLNRSFNRTQSVSELDKRLKQFLSQPEDPRVVGIDFLDNEGKHQALEKGQLLYGTILQAALSGKSRLHRTMHAGEIGDARNPRDAMILGAERLGHGVKLNDDPVALEYAAQNRVAVEINLTSNLRLTEVKTLKEHPYLDYLRLGVPVSMSTDDEGIFDTDIARDCAIAVRDTDVTYAELRKMAFNSIETSFAAEPDKAALLKKLQSSFAAFEAEVGHSIRSIVIE